MFRRSPGVIAALVALAAPVSCAAISGLDALDFEMAAGGAASTTASSAGGASACASAFDCNPRECIDVACEHGGCVVAASAEGVACEGGVCDGHGSCVDCVIASDCPQPKGACVVAGCTQRACSTANAASGTACGANDDRFCDGDGACVDCLVDDDCGATAICDPEQHVCVAGCRNGTKDGTETDVDCGGDCLPCAQGARCSKNADCLVPFCADGICCDSACTQACAACNLGSSPGVCSPLAQGTQDPGICDDGNGTCAGKCVCDGAEACLLASGESCVSNTDCASGQCKHQGGMTLCN